MLSCAYGTKWGIFCKNSCEKISGNFTSKREKVLDDKSFSLRVTEGVGGASGAAIAVRNTIMGLIDHVSVALEKGAFG